MEIDGIFNYAAFLRFFVFFMRFKIVSGFNLRRLKKLSNEKRAARNQRCQGLASSQATAQRARHNRSHQDYRHVDPGTTASSIGESTDLPDILHARSTIHLFTRSLQSKDVSKKGAAFKKGSRGRLPVRGVFGFVLYCFVLFCFVLFCFVLGLSASPPSVGVCVG